VLGSQAFTTANPLLMPASWNLHTLRASRPLKVDNNYPSVTLPSVLRLFRHGLVFHLRHRSDPRRRLIELATIQRSPRTRSSRPLEHPQGHPLLE